MRTLAVIAVCLAATAFGFDHAVINPDVPLSWLVSDLSLAAMKGRPKVQARAPASRPPKVGKKVLKMPARKPARPEKAKLAAPSRRHAAARTARADRPRMVAGGKRKR